MWPAVAAQATPIRRIHVSERGRFGQVRLDAGEQGLAALGQNGPDLLDGEPQFEQIDVLASKLPR